MSIAPFSTRRGGCYLLVANFLNYFIMYLLNIIYLLCIPVGGLAKPRVLRKPLPPPVETRTRRGGYGFARVGVRVALGNPRVTRDNH